jgi:hypothetical protein
MKSTWTNDDIDNMGFHDCRLYSVSFPGDTLKLKMDIDYIFDWILNNDRHKYDNTYSFMVAPCILVFDDVIDLKINLDFKNNVGIDILSLEQTYIKSTNKIKSYKYEIETDLGDIEFVSSGFTMQVCQPPILSEGQNLNRQ